MRPSRTSKSTKGKRAPFQQQNPVAIAGVARSYGAMTGTRSYGAIMLVRPPGAITTQRLSRAWPAPTVR